MFPSIKLDDKSFISLVEDARKMIPRYAPLWTDHNVHDPGITFIELIAWLTEMQHFYLDQIPEESYRKFLRMLGGGPASLIPARVDITFTSEWGQQGFSCDESLCKTVLVQAGTPIYAGEICFETVQDLYIPTVPVQINRITYSIDDDICQLNGHTDNDNDLEVFLPFGETVKQGSSFYVGFNAPFPAGYPISLTFLLQDDFPVLPAAQGQEDKNPTPSACLDWEYYGSCGKWYPLQVLEDETLILSRSGRIRLNLTGEMLGKCDKGAPLYWFRCLVRQAGYELAPRIQRILLNTVGAEQTKTVKNEWLGTGTGLPYQTYSLAEFPVLSGSVEIETIENGSIYCWSRVDDWATSGPLDRHYVLESMTGTLYFGDGIKGATPGTVFDQTETTIKARLYKSTLGAKGNIAKGQLEALFNPITVTGDDGIHSKLTFRVTNNKAATGGADPESSEAAQLRLRQELRTPSRAVTEEDYEYLALHTPGLRVKRAKAFVTSGNTACVEDETVNVIVIPYSDSPKPMPSNCFLDTVCDHLNRHRLICTAIKVVAPVYTAVSVEAHVSIHREAVFVQVDEAARQALMTFLNPLGGGPGYKGWTFGRPVYLSELYEVLENVPGVDCVHKLKVSGEGGDVRKNGNGNLLIDPFALVYPDKLRIIAITF